MAKLPVAGLVAVAQPVNNAAKVKLPHRPLKLHGPTNWCRIMTGSSSGYRRAVSLMLVYGRGMLLIPHPPSPFAAPSAISLCYLRQANTVVHIRPSLTAPAC